ncbi:hypothetical protein K503DRAFT_366754 [Rhizopogon vinicolor AM-OR11-026]|uniref:Protein kinase domain-containing protein n=1 Tax=Rhizopogon vinicolor AM-OR11-026 TaxID=1314800 RepID=A0A1B7MSE6_9AGAM|nr:hypothetical protein K503DRAFT_366754 [Rhizopogon vinicolor AM-OR11-026]
MNPPASSQHSSTPKHSSPNDLTEFITKLVGYDFPINDGGFGDVYKCTYKHKRGEQPVEIVVAVKVLRTRAQSDNEASRREIGIWKRMRHECIVPLLGTTTGFSADHRVSFVSSWMPNGTLNTYLKKEVSLRQRYNLVN